MSDLVYNVEPASPSMIRSLDRHCRKRVPDGASNIDPSRSRLNRLLVGDPRGLLQSISNLYASDVAKPAKQSESPYLRLVVSASPDYFRPEDPKAAGTWNEDHLEAWLDATMNQLQSEHGDDLVFAELHLDEDTPHIHAVVAPTYLKKARKPGRQKRNETAEQFEDRKRAAAEKSAIRTVGRASHPELSKKGSFQRLRERMSVAVDHLGIEYGEDRSINAPDGQTTREWVKEQAALLRTKQQVLAKEREAFEAECAKAYDRIAEAQQRAERALSVARDAEREGEALQARLEPLRAAVRALEAWEEQQLPHPKIEHYREAVKLLVWDTKRALDPKESSRLESQSFAVFAAVDPLFRDTVHLSGEFSKDYLSLLEDENKRLECSRTAGFHQNSKTWLTFADTLNELEEHLVRDGDGLIATAQARRTLGNKLALWIEQAVECVATFLVRQTLSSSSQEPPETAKLILDLPEHLRGAVRRALPSNPPDPF